MRYRKNIGDRGEEFAVKMLENTGYEIMEKNYWTKMGEADIIARKDGCLHFIEVKTRTSFDYGYPSDSITEEKKRSMRRVAEQYLNQRRMYWKDVSFDVYEIVANLVEDCM